MQNLLQLQLQPQLHPCGHPRCTRRAPAGLRCPDRHSARPASCCTASRPLCLACSLSDAAPPFRRGCRRGGCSAASPWPQRPAAGSGGSALQNRGGRRAGSRGAVPVRWRFLNELSTAVSAVCGRAAALPGSRGGRERETNKAKRAARPPHLDHVADDAKRVKVAAPPLGPKVLLRWERRRGAGRGQGEGGRQAAQHQGTERFATPLTSHTSAACKRPASPPTTQPARLERDLHVADALAVPDGRQEPASMGG